MGLSRTLVLGVLTITGCGAAQTAAPTTTARNRERMAGPFETLHACPAPVGGAITALATEHTGGPFRTVQLVQYGEADDAQCAVAIQLAAGWYLGDNFACADQDSGSYSTTTSLGIDVRNADTGIPLATVRYRTDLTYDSGTEESSTYRIECALDDDAPACSDPAVVSH